MHPRMLIAWLADGLNLVSGNSNINHKNYSVCLLVMVFQLVGVSVFFSDTNMS